MNKSFKVIWSKVKGCYVVASELAKNTSCKKVVLAVCLGLMLTSGPALAADNDIVEKDAQNIAYDISPANDGTNIAVGKNAKVFIGGGTQESMLSFGETVESTLTGMHIHSNEQAKKNLPSGIAVGTNTYARTGSIQIGDHTLEKNKIAIGDTTADKLRQFGVASTTLGTNSYTGGGFATTIGSYNVQSNPYEAGGFWDTLNNSTKNAFSTVVGTFNSNESMSGSSSSGVSNVITGNANKVKNSNGVIAIGAGNNIEESSGYMTTSSYSTNYKSVSEMQKALMDGVASNAGGATLAVGGANTAKYTSSSQLIGVSNSLTGTSGSISKYNMLDGYKNAGSNINNVSVIGSNNSVSSTNTAVVLGDNRTLTGASNSIVIGSSASRLTTSVANAVAIGSESNVTKNGGVALGSKSVASTDAGEAGYDPSTKTASTKTNSTWKATNAAVSVGGGTTVTRQITSVAAGTNDTDAVNVAQLKAAAIEVTGTGSITVTQTQDSTDGHAIYTISGTAGGGGKTYTAGDNITIDNDIISAKDTRNTVVAGDNTTIDETTNSDGSSTYTVNVKTDGQIENGNTGIVTGGTVYNETRVTNNGSYIKADNTAGQNLSVLDSQVKTNTDNISNLDNRVSNMGSSISKLGNRLDKVGAGAAALAALHPMDFDENNKLTFAAGLGNYRSQNAAAIGAFYRPDDWVMFSVGGAVGNGENMVNLGVSFALDRKTGAKNLNKTQSSQKIAELENKIQQQDQMMASMQQQMAAMQETINRLTSK